MISSSCFSLFSSFKLIWFTFSRVEILFLSLLFWIFSHFHGVCFSNQYCQESKVNELMPTFILNTIFGAFNGKSIYLLRHLFLHLFLIWQLNVQKWQISYIKYLGMYREKTHFINKLISTEISVQYLVLLTYLFVYFFTYFLILAVLDLHIKHNTSQKKRRHIRHDKKK